MPENYNTSVDARLLAAAEADRQRQEELALADRLRQEKMAGADQARQAAAGETGFGAAPASLREAVMAAKRAEQAREREAAATAAGEAPRSSFFSQEAKDTISYWIPGWNIYKMYADIGKTQKAGQGFAAGARWLIRLFALFFSNIHWILIGVGALAVFAVIVTFWEASWYEKAKMVLGSIYDLGWAGIKAIGSLF